MNRRVPPGLTNRNFPPPSTDVVNPGSTYPVDDLRPETPDEPDPFEEMPGKGALSPASTALSTMNKIAIGIASVVVAGFVTLMVAYAGYNAIVVSQARSVTDDLPKIYTSVQTVGPAQPFDVGVRGTVVAIYPPVFDNTTALNNEPYLTYQNAPGLPYSSRLKATAPLQISTGDTVQLQSPYLPVNATYPMFVSRDQFGLVGDLVSGPPPITNANALTYLNTTVADALDAAFVTIGPSLLPNGHALTAINGISASVSPGSVSLGLTTTTVVPGSYSRADITVGSDGRLTAAASTPEPTSSNIPTTTNGTIQQSLNSNIMVTTPSPHLPGSRVFLPDPLDFYFNDDATNGTYTLSRIPGPLAFTSCTTIASLAWDSNGDALSCISAPTPGTANGYATLDSNGIIYESQLPSIFFSGPTFLGLWNAFNNTPFLTPASCGTNASFYYVVSDSGNVTLGAHSNWLELDWVVCYNGTFDRLRTPEHIDVSSFNGRAGVVLPQLGDYDANLISIGIPYTAANMVASPFVIAGPAPWLPSALSLAGTAGEISVSGATVGLTAKSAFPLLSNIFPDFMCNTDVDHNGRLTASTACTAVRTVTGTADQVIITGTAANPIFGLPQPIATTSSPTFANPTVTSLVMGTKTVAASGGGTVTIPAVGTADFVMTEGAQTINGVKSFTSAPIVRSDQGITLNNAANTFRQFLLPATGLAADLTIRFPPNAGTSGFVLSTDGAGVTTWVANTAGSVTSVSAVSPLSSTGGSTPQISISTTPTFDNATAGTLLGTSQVCIGPTCLVSSGTASSLTMPATVPLANQILYASSPTALAFGSVNALIPGRITRFFFATANTTPNNVVVATTMFGPGTGSLTIAANTLQAGLTIEFYLGGTMTLGGSGYTWDITLGGSVLGSCTLTGAAAAAGFDVQGRVFIRSVAGVNMVVVASGVFSRAATLCTLTPVGTVTLNPTIALAFDVRFRNSVNNAGNVMTVFNGYAQYN